MSKKTSFLGMIGELHPDTSNFLCSTVASPTPVFGLA